MLKTKLKPNIGIKSIILIVFCGALIAADLLTKHFEEACHWDFVIIPGFIEVFGNIRNPGCAFSFLDDNPQIGQPILISFTMIMLVFLVFVFIVVPERFTVMKVAISIVIAGAIGNLVDRFALREVRDFIGLNMFFNPSSLVYCNLADFFIVIGAAMVVIDMLFFSEIAVFPLTKKAKAAQAARRAEEEAESKALQPNAEASISVSEEICAASKEEENEVGSSGAKEDTQDKDGNEEQ